MKHENGRIRMVRSVSEWMSEVDHKIKEQKHLEHLRFFIPQFLFHELLRTVSSAKSSSGYRIRIAQMG